MILSVGYSFTNDIKDMKGRRKRRVFERTTLKMNEHNKIYWGKERLEAGDPEFTKFLTKKERSHGHH